MIRNAANPPATARGNTSPQNPRSATSTPTSSIAAKIQTGAASLKTSGIAQARADHATRPTPAHAISFDGARSVKNQWIAANAPRPSSAIDAAEAFMKR